MRRLLTALGSVALVGLVAPAPANADEVDDAFLASLSNAGINFRNPEQAVTAGHTVCQLIKGRKQGPEVLAVLQSSNPGITPDGARRFMGISLNAYCPELLPPSGS
ncbi:DUF732 domain-containing protein [Mycobacterium sp.]|uniref:DUF732 domain-containing protein n=1 Tax=Mycobacterium sp. TaxID=1785 RepID=UPI0025EF06C4|nr:DUF732 domain-containing protein [Mycobacterium sp.]